MVELLETPEGIVLRVRAQPGASHSGLCGAQSGALKLAVTQVAEKGKANDAIVQVLADALGLKRSQIELHSGATQRDKRLLVRGLARADLASRIAAALGG